MGQESKGLTGPEYQGRSTWKTRGGPENPVETPHRSIPRVSCRPVPSWYPTVTSRDTLSLLHPVRSSTRPIPPPSPPAGTFPTLSQAPAPEEPDRVSRLVSRPLPWVRRGGSTPRGSSPGSSSGREGLLLSCGDRGRSPGSGVVVKGRKREPVSTRRRQTQTLEGERGV